VTASRPNVVVIVQDSVRYDRTTLGGHRRDTTPSLARLAEREDARTFEHATAHARYTLPSSASMLTGTAPSTHDVGFGRTTLDSSTPTVAEAFRDAGYETSLVTNNYFVSSDTNLDRGFETYTQLPNSPLGILKTVGVESTLRWLTQLRRHSAGFDLDKHRHSGAYLMHSLVEDELDRLAGGDDPFFLYAHFNQPHRPYYPPLAWFEKYADAFEMSTRDAGDFSMDLHRNLVEKVAKGCPFTDDEWRVLSALYDAGIEYTDTFMGELFEQVSASTDETVFVVTADHGEHLGERGALGHKYVLDDALLNVPLLTVGLDVPESTELVQHADVMRTLLDTAGARSGFVDGVDLRAQRPNAGQRGRRALARPDLRVRLRVRREPVLPRRRRRVAGAHVPPNRNPPVRPRRRRYPGPLRTPRRVDERRRRLPRRYRGLARADRSLARRPRRRPHPPRGRRRGAPGSDEGSPPEHGLPRRRTVAASRTLSAILPRPRPHVRLRRGRTRGRGIDGCGPRVRARPGSRRARRRRP